MPFTLGKSCHTMVTQGSWGASVNIRVACTGGARNTGGQPGTGLS
jgi:hypothetical protein